MKQKKRVIIIGSGMSGMALGSILGRHNYDVTILEKNQQIGGNLQVFSRDKTLFDSSVHYIGGLQPGGNANRIFHYLGIFDKLELNPLDVNAFDKIRLSDGTLIPLAYGYEHFEKQLVEYFPKEKEAIQKIVKTIKEFCSYFPLYNLEASAEKTYYTNPEILEIGAWDLLNSLTSDERLVQAILGSGPLYAGKKEKTPFYVVALILNSYIEGSYKLKGGGASINKAFLKVFHELGVHVKKRKEVIGARYHSDGSVAAVQCSDGTEYEGDHFISTLHPGVTINIFGENNFLKAYVNRIRKLPNTVAPFMMYLRLKPETIPFENSNYYEYFSPKIWELENDDMSIWPRVFYFTFSEDTNNPGWAKSASTMCYLPMHHLEKWRNSENSIVNPSERGEDYDSFKQELEEKTFNRVLERWPQLREATDGIYSSTPLTYRDFLSTPDGSLYGIQKDFNRSQSSILNPKTRIPNLYLSGQNLIFHGVFGSCISALVTSFNFIDKDQFLKEV